MWVSPAWAKADLLRSLSGLGQDVIPDRGGDPCTGVRSAIFDQPGSDTYAEIEYHTPQSLLEILWAYWDKIKLPLARPYNLDAFFSINLPEEAPPSEHAAEHQELLNELRKYQRIRPLINHLGTTQTVRREDIARPRNAARERNQRPPGVYVPACQRSDHLHAISHMTT